MASGDGQGLRLGVLGSVVAFDAGGSELDLPSSSLRRLAAILVAHSGAVVSSWILADALSVTPAAVRSSIARLRRVVGADVVVTEPPGYRLNGVETDAAQFRRAVDAGGTGHERLQQLEEALGLWRGEPYAEFDSESWAQADVVQLAEMRNRAELEVAEILLELGRAAVAIERLAAIVQREPFSDAPRALRIRALALAGRTTEATREYQSYRRMLDLEVGLTPSTALTQLVRRVLAGDVDPAPPPALRSVQARTRHAALPQPGTPPVGREREIAEVRELVAGRFLVTLTGPGGVGKTRIAQHVALQIADDGTEAVWVDLSVIDDGDLVAELVLSALSSASAPGPEPMAALLAEVSQRTRTFVVLDNAEHVLSGVASVVSALGVTDSVALLVTSRIRLGLRVERELPVRPLELPPTGSDEDIDLDAFAATRLFMDRLRDAGGSIPLDPTSISTVVSICRRLDGIPLAIEFAASHARHLPLASVLDGLYGPASLLVADSADTTPRHRTIAHSVEWSVSFLDSDQTHALDSLGVFNAPFTLDAAVAVIGGHPTAARDLLLDLVDRHLVQFEPGGGRYRLLELVRQYLVLHADPARLSAARTRHLHFFASWAAAVGAGRHGIRREPVLVEMPHVVTAMTRARECDPSSAFAMCAGLASFRSTLGHHRELTETWRWLVTTDFDEQLRPAWAEAAAGLIAAATGAQLDVTDAIPVITANLSPDSARARGWLTRGVSMVPAYRGNFDPICSYIDEVIERRDDPELSVYGGFVVYMLAMTGQLERAEMYLGEITTMIGRHRTDFTVDAVGNGFAGALHIDLARGRWRTALTALDADHPSDPAFTATAAAAIAQAGVGLGRADLVDLATRWSARGTLQILGFLDPLIRHYASVINQDVASASDEAEDFWERAAVVPVSRVNQIATVSSALVAAGRLEAARSAVDVASAAVSEMHDVPLLRCLVDWSEALVELSRDNHLGALAAGRRSLERALAHGFALATVDSLEVLALAALDVGHSKPAACLAAVAKSKRETTGYQHFPAGGTARHSELTRIAGHAVPGSTSDALAMLDTALAI